MIAMNSRRGMSLPPIPGAIRQMSATKTMSCATLAMVRAMVTFFICRKSWRGSWIILLAIKTAEKSAPIGRPRVR